MNERRWNKIARLLGYMKIKDRNTWNNDSYCAWGNDHFKAIYFIQNSSIFSKNYQFS